MESVRALSGVRVDGRKLAEYLEPCMLLLVATSGPAGGPSAGPSEERPATKACAAVITTDGYCLTAAHVVRGALRAAPTTGDQAGVFAAARVVWTSGAEAPDLALLHVEGLRFDRALDMRRAGVADLGTRVVLGGYPGGALRIAISGGTLTSVTATAPPRLGAPASVVIEHSAPGQQGDSGGPVIDAQGRLIGVANAGYWTPLGGWQGVASLPHPAWLARVIEADRARRR